MPGVEAPSLFGCYFAMGVAPIYLIAFVSIFMTIVSRAAKRPPMANVARVLAAIAFVAGIILVIDFSYSMRSDYRPLSPSSRAASTDF